MEKEPHRLKAESRMRIIAMLFAVGINAVLIATVIFSVVTAFREAAEDSFRQDVQNVRTLTDAAANKIELEFSHNKQELLSAANCINSFGDIGMTKAQVYDFFTIANPETEWEVWELVDNASLEHGSVVGFAAELLPPSEAATFVYRPKSYLELARIFSAASAQTMGTVRYGSEFTDASPRLSKSGALTTTVRLRQEPSPDAPDAPPVYTYHTLMLLVQSDYVNKLLATHNEIDTLSYFDFSCVIIDDDGNYVFSNTSFQGTNFTDYLALYNDNFTKTEETALREALKTENYSEVLYYRNNRGEDCVYTIVPVQNSSWHILSLVPVHSFQGAEVATESYLRFFLAFTLLFFVDMGLVLFLNSELRRKKREAEAASVAKSRFLSSMSHDIRTPMNAIIGETMLAKEDLDASELDREALKDCIKTIELSGNHLMTLINDILDISKIESGRVALSPEDFSITETVDKMLEIVQPQIKEKKLDLQTQLAVTHPFVHADELRINQIFINILSNAIKYTEPGGHITVALSEGEAPAGTDRARIVYRVGDTGIGMDPEFQKTIFDRFTRAVDTRINAVQGTGLGMSIVKQLVDLMGGSITVESELNVGSTFTVTLDLPMAKAPAAEVRAVPDKGQNYSLRVLVAEDNAVNWKVLNQILRRRGIEADRAQNGQLAVEAVRDALPPYDLVLMDIQMPVMNGYEAAKAIRALGDTARAATPLYAMTADAFAEDVAKAAACGMNGHLSKPVEVSKLYRVLAKVSETAAHPS